MRYFDVVSADALSVLVKYLSHQPYHKEWLSTVKLNDVQTALQVDGLLSEVSRSMFKSLDCSDFGFLSSDERVHGQIMNDFVRYVDFILATVKIGLCWSRFLLHVVIICQNWKSVVEALVKE